jgi:hypothetical protein
LEKQRNDFYKQRAKMDRIMEQLLVCGNLCVARQIKKCNLLFYSYRFVDNQLRKKKKKKKKQENTLV